VEKAQFYLRHPAQAAAMGLAGRAAVEARHDIRQRLATMLDTAKVAAE
jgi:spore maturation protein CgeB